MDRTDNLMNRARRHYAVLLVVVIALGLAERKFATFLPGWCYQDIGDVLWALAVFLFCAFLRPAAGNRRIALAALVFAFLIEASQLYHAPWIDRLRGFRPAGLILGYGFSWRDLLCYAVGVGMGTFVGRRISAPLRLARGDR